MTRLFSESKQRKTYHTGMLLMFWLLISVLGLNANEPPTSLSIDSNVFPENQPRGTLIGTLSAEDADLEENHRFYVVGGKDEALTYIKGDKLYAREIFDFEKQTHLDLIIQVTDRGKASLEFPLTIEITDVNDPPTDLEFDGEVIPENLEAGTPVGTLYLEDVDPGAVSPEADNPDFPILHLDLDGVANNSLLNSLGLPEMTPGRYVIRLAENSKYTAWSKWPAESPTNEGWSNEFHYSLNGRNSIGHQTNWYYDTVEEALANAIPLVVDVWEGEYLRFFLNDGFSSSNRGGLSLDVFLSAHFSLVEGKGDTDNRFFKVEGAELKLAKPLDYESQSSYSIRIKGTDPGGASIEKVIALSSRDQPDAPSRIYLTNASIPESSKGGTAIGNFMAEDEDARETHTFVLTEHPDGEETDNHLFYIQKQRTGTFLFTQKDAAFDFETRANYTVYVQATDKDGMTLVQPVAVHIENSNEPPVDIEISALSFPENLPSGTDIATLTTVDPDLTTQEGEFLVEDSHNYFLVEGEGDTHNRNFRIDRRLGVLKTRSAVDFEETTKLSIRIQSMDAAKHVIEKVFILEVTNANDPPSEMTFSPATATMIEEESVGTLVGTFSVFDVDSDDPAFEESHTYALTEGNGDSDNNHFQIDGNEIRILEPLIHLENPTARFHVTVTDKSGGSFSRSFSIEILDRNDAPTEIILDNLNVLENQPHGTLVGSLGALDPDLREEHTFRLVEGEGDSGNGNFFILDGNRLVTSATFDFEQQPTQSIRIEATDKDGATLTQTFEIQIEDEAEEPERIQLAVSRIPPDGGLTIGAGVHEPESDVTLKAVAAPGYNFAGWIGDLPDGADPGDQELKYKLVEPRTIEAVFSRKFHTVKVVVFPERHGYANGGGLVLNGTTITLTAREIEGKDNVPFSHWRINNVNYWNQTELSMEVTVEKDMFVEAVFDIGLDENFVLIPAGKYTRESGGSEEHLATASAFYTTTHETTKAEWYSIYKWAIKNGYSFNFDPARPTGRNLAHNDRAYLDDFPITGVTWGDMVRWCNARSEREGWSPLYFKDTEKTTPIRLLDDLLNEEELTEDKVNWRERGYRLPTELEWERAARGGLEHKLFPKGDSVDETEAFFGNNTNTRALDSTHSNTRIPNGYGLYDTVGNAWEACWDFYSKTWYENPGSRTPDNKGPGVTETGLKRNIRTARGGSGNSDPKQLIIGNRTMLKTWQQYAITIRPAFPAPTEPVASLYLSTEQAHLGSVIGGGIYAIGSPARLEAQPREGAEFIQWLDEEGNQIGQEPTLEMVLQQDRNVQAVFQDTSGPELYSLIVKATPEERGTVTGTGAYLSDSRVRITATPVRGYGFAGWSEDAFGTNRIFRFKIQKHSRIIGTFGDTSKDDDRDGLSNLYESVIGSNPRDADSDGDKLKDGQEVDIFGSNPTNPDTDGDGHDDRSEVFHKTSLTDAGVLPFLPNSDLVRYLYAYRGQPFDFSGNKGHATAHNVSIASDRAKILNRAFEFNGIDSYIETTAYLGIEGAGARAFGGWLRVQEGDFGPIFSYGIPGQHWEIRVGNGGVLEVEAGDATLTTTQSLDDGNWHHFLVSIPQEGTPQDINIFLNGQPQQTIIVGEVESPLSTVLNSYVFIGKNSDDQHFRGDLDELRIWERNLIAHEAAELYDLEVPKEPEVLPPTLEEDLEDALVTLGDPATFSVTVKAKPEPSYRWEKLVENSWQQIRGFKTNSLSIESVKETDATSYRVTISNSQGTLTTHPARILIKTKPTLTKSPEDVSLLINKGGRIYAHATGSSPLIYEWFRNGQSLGTGPNSYYIPNSASEEDHGGTYFFRVTNEMGTVRSSNFRVSIVDRIAITKDPESKGINEGQPGEMSVEVEGSGTVRYQWKKYDIRNRSFFDINGATEATYRIEAMTRSDEGIYICEVSNGASADSSKRATLTMYISPVFEVQPQSQTLIELGRSKLITLATGDPSPNYQWQKYNSDTDAWEDLEDSTNSYLYFPKTLHFHAGRYRVLAENLGGTATSNEVDLNVYFSPSITRDLEEQTIHEGESLTLKVDAIALDRRGSDIRYEWFHNKSPISDGRGITGSNTNTLEISSLTGEHNGSWYCILSNDIGRTQTRPAKLDIIEKPYALNELEDKNLISGDYLTLAVSVRGNKPLTLQWYKNGQPIEGATVNKLHIRSLRPTDTGVYTFEAINPAGRMTLSSTVIVTSSSTAASPDMTTSGIPEFDDDQDGLSNLLEEVLGSDPLNQLSVHHPTTEVVEDGSGETFLAFHYSEVQSLPGITCIVEQSTDLENWEPIDWNEAIFSRTLRENLLENTIYIPATSGNRFIRLRVEKD